MLHAAVMVLFAQLLGVRLSLQHLLVLVPICLVVCLFGGSFGLIAFTGLRSQRGANEILPFLLFPQFFLAGILSLIASLPPLLNVLSHLAPLRYAVDWVRGTLSGGTSLSPRGADLAMGEPGHYDHVHSGGARHWHLDLCKEQPTTMSEPAYRFPDDFLWGIATGGYQFEGGNFSCMPATLAARSVGAGRAPTSMPKSCDAMA